MSLVSPTPSEPTIAANQGSLVPGLASAFRGSINTYVGAIEDKVQSVQYYHERENYLRGYGAVSGGTISAGAGLSVTIGTLTAVVGNYIQTSAVGTVGGLPENDTSYIYLRQDGEFTSNIAGTVPGTGDGHGEALYWGYAVTDGSSVTSVDNLRAPYRAGGMGVPWLYLVASNCDADLATGAWRTCAGTADHVDLQAAVDAIYGSTGFAGGGIVQLSPGKFYITQPINLRPGVEIRGAGMTRTWVQMGTAVYNNIFQLIGTPLYSGTAESGTVTSLVDSDASWTTNAYANKYVVFRHGPGVGQVGSISSNNGTALTFGTVSVAAGSATVYAIYPQAAQYDIAISDMALSWATSTPYSNTIVSGTVDSIYQTQYTWDANVLQNNILSMLTGTASLETRLVESNGAGTATLAEPFTNTPAAGDTFVTGGCGVVVWNQYLRRLLLRNLYISPQMHGIALTPSYPEVTIENVQMNACVYGCNILLEAPVWARTGLLPVTQVSGRITGGNLWNARYGNVRVRPYVYNIAIVNNEMIPTDRRSAGVIVDGGAGHVVANNVIRSSDTTTTTASGTATAGGSVVLVDDTKTWATNAYTDYTVHITGGTGAGQRRIIASNDGTALVPVNAFDTDPDATSEYSLNSRSQSGVKVNGGYGITITGNQFTCRQSGMVNGIYNVAGSALIATGNVTLGETATGYAGILDMNSQVTDAGNLAATTG